MATAARDHGLCLLVCFLGCVHFALAQTGYVYQLDTEYAGANFFQGWNFYMGGDPTGGYVTYYSQASAQQAGLINSSVTAPTYIGVDYQTVTNVNGAGRPSVRISTQKSWTHGLFIGDFNHAPGGICGTWPAWWTLGPNWPYNGEIDILEGVNQLTKNAMSLHSNVNCSIAGDPSTETGTVQGTDCAYYVQYGGNGQGCGVQDSQTTSYGTGFNAVGGGVYAMQWTSDYIRVWFFQRSQIPQDITNLTPNPANWGLPAANLQGSCNIDQRFQSHEIIFDNTFCGSYAGVASVWNSSTNSCLLQTGYPTCDAFVAAQPAAFQNAYWSINSVRVYQLQAADASSSAAPYIASLQPTVPSASAASSVAVAVPTASLCPAYNFTVVQEGSFQYEVECGYNPPGSDLGPPHSNYVVHSFEDCIGGCTYWNTYNGSYVCGGVAYVISSSACYWKKSISSAPAAPGYNGARLIYYGYPQVTDNPNVATTTTSTSVFVSTSIAPQYYVNPNVTQSSRALSSASATITGGGVGAGFSIGASTSSITTSPSISSSTAVSTSSLTLTSCSAQTSMTSASSATSNTLSSSPSSSSPSSSSSIEASTISATVVTTSSSTSTSSISTTSPALTSTSSQASSIVRSSSSTIFSSSRFVMSSSASFAPPSSTSTVQSSISSSSSSTFTPAPTPPQNTIATSLFSSSSSMIPNMLSLAPSATPFTGDNPQSIAQFRYGGCQGSSNNFAGFRQVESRPTMSIEICVSDCFNSAFAGVFGGTCYCADDPSVANYFVTYPDTDCDTPCPGMLTESCGGTITAVMERRRRAAAAYTIYNNANLVPDSGVMSSSSSSIVLSSKPLESVIVGTIGTSSEGQSSPISTTAVISLSVPPALSTPQPLTSISETLSSSGTVILGPGGGSLSITGTSVPLISPSATVSNSITLQPIAITTIYVDICDFCEHGMTTATTIITVMHCGCTESVDDPGSTVPVPPPTVPMITTVKTCNCGKGNALSTTEVTIPCTSRIEETSSCMASMLASPTPGTAALAQAPFAAVTGQAGDGAPAAVGENAPEASATDRELPSMSEGEPESTSTEAAQASAESATDGDIPEMTNSPASEAGIPSGYNETSYATTKTIHLQSTEALNASTPKNGNMSISVPRFGHPSTTKKSEGSAAVERPLGFMATALFCILVVMSLL